MILTLELIQTKLPVFMLDYIVFELFRDLDIEV